MHSTTQTNSRRAIGLATAVVASLAWIAPAAGAPITFTSSLGPDAVGATGSGSVTVVYSDALHTLSIDATFSGLSGTTTVAHIHCCTALPGTGAVGVAVTPGTLPGFPVGVTSGSYSRTLDLTLLGTYTTTFINVFGGGTIGGAEAALIQGLTDGKAYFNVHTTQFPGGEIRGFPAPVPEPGTFALLGLGIAGFGLGRRRRI